MSLAIIDGSPSPITGWLAVTLAAAQAGAACGAVLDRHWGAPVLAGASALGMQLGTIAAGIFMQAAPVAIDSEGTVQHLYFALAQGIVGASTGASVGAAAAWLKQEAARENATGEA